MAGSGPPVVLVHGMVNSSAHWRQVAQRLADRYTVIAPDLVGHGDSATPRGDYSLGAGVAMVYFWQFPHRVERLALVSSGGLGRDVSPLLRSAAMPGASAAIAAAAHERVTAAGARAGRELRRRGVGLGVQLQAIARALSPLSGPGAREAFVQTLRAVIDRHGQRVGALDRLYLLDGVPTLIAWGERDRTIPIEHGLAAHRAVPGSRFVTFPE